MATSHKIAQSTTITNYQTIGLDEVVVMPYGDFYEAVLSIMRQSEANHVVNYFAFREGETLKFIMVIADDKKQILNILSHELSLWQPLESYSLLSLTAAMYQFHIFEREIWENFGVHFENHPWLKPVRFAFDRANSMKVNDYPFYRIDSEELHEVGVGPIHAGVIEPGHFRFICNGEMVLHLEIQLGWQHRGVEKLYLEKTKLLQQTVLSESIAGDTAIGHALAFVTNIESNAALQVDADLAIERTIALELERIAMALFDLSNLNVGTAYQLASSVYGALRTPVINYFQAWCGNRFGKGLIRVGGTHYPLTTALQERLTKLLDEVEWRSEEMSETTFNLPSLQTRFEEIGKVTYRQMYLIGAVGQAAKAAGLKRDTRWSHPNDTYKMLAIKPVTLPSGDVWARFSLRRLELIQSIGLIRQLLAKHPQTSQRPAPKYDSDLTLKPNGLTVVVNEGWRGEICHTMITGMKGEITHYKVKDPSMHNWLALALSLRDLEISDFPINNKSYNLSYCGFDL